MAYDLPFLARQFRTQGEVTKIAPIPVGHINDTYLVATAGNRYVLQRINHYVFKKPVQVMANVVRITEHIRAKMTAEKKRGHSSFSRGTEKSPGRATGKRNEECPHFRQLEVIAARDGGGYYQDADGNVWRMYNFIENAVTYDSLQSAPLAREGARMFGWFQRMLIDLPGPPLYETIVDFHNTPRRWERFQEVVKADAAHRASSAKAEIDYAFEHATICHTLFDLVKQGAIPVRTAHNDAKINNVMFDTSTREGVCVIDLDTVMPGLSAYDFGDLVRTAT